MVLSARTSFRAAAILANYEGDAADVNKNRNMIIKGNKSIYGVQHDAFVCVKLHPLCSMTKTNTRPTFNTLSDFRRT